MQIVRHPTELKTASRKVCLAIGTFDGVHLGHQQVIRQALTDARQHGDLAVAVTFDRHPNAVVAPTRTPPLIYSLDQKLRSIGAIGIDAILLLPFDEAFSCKSGEVFIRELADGFGQMRSICVGNEFVFGHRRSGNTALLRGLGAELDFSVHSLAAVALDQQVVSSTRIRERIRAGDLDGASQMLGRAYSVSGLVVAGDGLGRTLGVPTANVDVAGLVLPPSGVYAARALLGERALPAVLNIGVRPTLGEGSATPRLEVHLLDFSGDLYGRELEVVFFQALRAEQKFAGLEELRKQIERDISRARELLG
jgi:riboflavin kinase / FMN adenylyltransferase